MKVILVEAKSYPIEKIVLPDVYQIINYVRSLYSTKNSSITISCEKGVLELNKQFNLDVFLAFKTNSKIGFKLVLLRNNLLKSRLEDVKPVSATTEDSKYIIGFSCKYCDNESCPFNPNTNRGIRRE